MGVEKIGDITKLPTRALMFAQMKYLSNADPTKGATIKCSKVMLNGDGAEEPCSFLASFSATSKIVQWSWFGDSLNIFKAD